MKFFLRVMLVVAVTVSVRGQSGVDTIAQADLLAGLTGAERWVTFSGDYTGQRHSPLTQIAPSNVDGLKEQWTFDSGLPVGNRGTEATPLFFGGRLYLTGLAGHAWALDARTGRPAWTYRREYPSGMVNCCGAINRGFAVLGDTLYMGTIDARVIALRVADGSVIWESPVADGSKGYSVTMAPLVVKDKVIVGVSGSEFPTRGFIDAYDARTGKRVWRFYTVPAPGEPGSNTWPSPDAMAKGGGGVWVAGSYDPELNLVFYGTGNPNPAYYGQDRQGDNLYTSSLVALDADTGKLRWHYQFTPHDLHDWDAAQVPVLATVPLKQGLTKVVMQANRNGLFYVLDRATGKCAARPSVRADHVGDRRWGRRAAARAERSRYCRGLRARSPRCDELSAAVLRSGSRLVLCHGARDVCGLRARRAGASASRQSHDDDGTRTAARERHRQLPCASRDRRSVGREEMGDSL